MSKKRLRQLLRQRMAAVPREQLLERSSAACGLLCEQPEYKQAEVVMVFLSTPQEVDTSMIAQQAWRSLKSVLAPRVSWEQRRMLPIEIRSLTTDVHPGRLGLREPVAGLPVPVCDIDLIIVPGLAFDEQGNRLGRGGGFYDRFLAHPDQRAVSCALALEEQVVDSVPHGAHDVRVDLLVTDVCVRRFGR